MFGWIISSSMQLRGLAIGVAVAIIIFGVFQLKKMPLDVFPEFGAPVVEIQTEALGLSAEEVESLVTLNIEELLSGVPWTTSMRSESITGLSSIKLTFERGTDLMDARQMVSERLTLAYALPNISDPPHVMEPVSTTNRFMMVGVSSDAIEPTELSIMAQWIIRPRLLGIQGVSSVSIWGLRPRELQVQIDPERLRDARLMQDDILRAAGNSMWVTPLSFLKGSSPGTGGFIDNNNQRLGVHHDQPIFTPEDMAKVPLSPQHLTMTGKQMALGDVSEVTYGHAPMIGDAIVNGTRGMMIVLDKLPSANTVQVTRDVEAALTDLRLGFPGVVFDSEVFQLSSYIESSISNLFKAIILGSILMALVVGIFLYNLRAAFVALVAIPVSAISALLIAQSFGVTLNTMIISGLIVALGIVIGDSIIDMDRVVKSMREGQRSGDNASISNVIYLSVLNNKNIAIFTVLTVALAVLPIFFIGGLAGAFLEPLAFMYLISVGVSFVVGMVLTPALSIVLLRKSSKTVADAPVLREGNKVYGNILKNVASMPKLTTVLGIAFVLVGGLIWAVLGHSLLPSFKEKNVVVNWSTAPGTSLKETSRIVSRVSEEFTSVPGVSKVSAHIGRAVSGDQVVGINDSKIWLNIDSSANHDETVSNIRDIMQGYPGVDSSLGMYLHDTVNEVITGESAPIVVRIFGHNREILEQKAKDVQKALVDIDDLANVRIIGQVQEPQIRVRVDLDAAAAANVKPGEVRRSAATIFSGLNVGYLFEEQKLFNVMVWSPSESRQSLADLKDVLVEKSDRHHVRLGDIAEIEIVSTPVAIKHESISPYIDVVAETANASVSLGAVSKTINASLQEIDFPLEYHPELLGEYSERQGVTQKVLGLVIAALIGVFLLLQACFHSWRLAGIAFMSVPASVAGGFIAILIFDSAVISLGSIVGFLALLGLSTRYSILLINCFQKLKQLGIYTDSEIIQNGSKQYFSPIISSCVAILAAITPLLIFGASAGLEIIQPAVSVIFGGLITSTLMTLLVIPALYLLVAPDLQNQAEFSLDFIGQESSEVYAAIPDEEKHQKDVADEARTSTANI